MGTVSTKPEESDKETDSFYDSVSRFRRHKGFFYRGMITGKLPEGWDEFCKTGEPINKLEEIENYVNSEECIHLLMSDPIFRKRMEDGCFTFFSGFIQRAKANESLKYCED